MLLLSTCGRMDRYQILSKCSFEFSDGHRLYEKSITVIWGDLYYTNFKHAIYLVFLLLYLAV
jgi:hypothetical protein